MALWQFGHFKLVSKIYLDVFELEAWNVVSWKEMISRLFDKIKKKIILIFRSYSPLKIWAFETCQQDMSKIVWARGLKRGQLIGDDM